MSKEKKSKPITTGAPLDEGSPIRIPLTQDQVEMIPDEPEIIEAKLSSLAEELEATNKEPQKIKTPTSRVGNIPKIGEVKISTLFEAMEPSHLTPNQILSLDLSLNRLKVPNKGIEAKLKSLGIYVKEGNKYKPIPKDVAFDYNYPEYRGTLTDEEIAYIHYLSKYPQPKDRRGITGVIYLITGKNWIAGLLGDAERDDKKPKGRRLTAIGIHTASQFFADSKQMSLFSDQKVEEFINATGLSLRNKPKSYGVVLNQTQRKVLEGVLKAFSDTNYLGDEQIEKFESLESVYRTGSGTARKIISEAYGNIDKIPVINITQAELIELSGYDLSKQRQGDKDDVIEAINYLGQNQFCFYWIRLKKDEKGKPLKNKSGDYAKEEVMEVGTLLRVQYIRDETDKDKNYYRIFPSAVMLDQVNNHYGGNYFLLIPNNWRDEVKQLTGKKASSYTYELLFWLRLQYEHIRRRNANAKVKKPFSISKSWEEVAEIIKMPESMYKKNRKRASKMIEDAYTIAIKLGYLLRVENNGATDTLYLNEAFYPKPGALI